MGSPTDGQVQAYATTRYQALASVINGYAYNQHAALRADSIAFTLSASGITNYRPQAAAALGVITLPRHTGPSTAAASSAAV